VGEASIVAIFEYSVFLFGSVFALMLFGQTVDFWQGVGFAQIILGGRDYCSSLGARNRLKL
jgi:drug/metabolite transporter (DMT)-like permease